MFDKDIVLTQKWVDSKAFNSLNDALTYILTNEQTLVIDRAETVTSLTIPSNISLYFTPRGSISNSGTLLINTTKIEANSQIFKGTGAVNFTPNTVVRTSWFADFETAVSSTYNDTVTLLVDKPDTLNNDAVVGDNVILKWTSPNLITISSGYTLSNVSVIDAPLFQLFALNGSVTTSSSFFGTVYPEWFNNSKDHIAIANAIEFIGSNYLPMTLSSGTWSINADLTIPSNIYPLVVQGKLTINTGRTLTLSRVNADSYQIFDCVGTGSVVFSGNYITEVLPEWWGGSVADAIDSLPNGGTVKLSANSTYSAEDVTISANNLNLVGAGLSTIVNGSSSPSKTMFTVTGDNFRCESIKFVSLSTPTDLFGTAGTAFIVQGSNATFRHNWFESYAISIKQQVSSGKSGLIIENNDFYKNVYFPIWLESTSTTSYLSNTLVNYNNFHGNELRASIGGTDYYGAYMCTMSYVKKVTISNNYVAKMCQNCINNTDYELDNGYIVEDIWVLNNKVDDATMGSPTSRQFCELQHAKNVYIIGNTIPKSTGCLGVDYSFAAHSTDPTYNENIIIKDNLFTMTPNENGTSSWHCVNLQCCTRAFVSGNKFQYDRSVHTYGSPLDVFINLYNCDTVNVYDNILDGKNLSAPTTTTKYVRNGYYISTGSKNINIYRNVINNCQYAGYVVASVADFAINKLYHWGNMGNCTLSRIAGYDVPVGYYYSNGLYVISTNSSIPSATTYGVGFTWNIGDRVYKSNPTAAGIEGWVCTTAGTFGTLSGVTGSIDLGSTSLTVNDATNLQVGKYITIAGVTGKKMITEVSGTTVTIDTASDATVSGATVSYSAPTLKTFGEIET